MPEKPYLESTSTLKTFRFCNATQIECLIFYFLLTCIYRVDLIKDLKLKIYVPSDTMMANPEGDKTDPPKPDDNIDPKQENTLPEYFFYNKRYVADSFGMYNTGSICWWNSTLQVLFRLPAFNMLMLSLEHEFDSRLASAYIHVIKNLLPCDKHPITPQNRQDFALASQAILKEFATEAKRRSKSVQLVEQQSPVWGLGDFLELLGHDGVYRVFNNKYITTIYCEGCDKKISINNDKSTHIDMYFVKPLKTKEDFEEYVKYHFTRLDEFKCEFCNTHMKNIHRLETLSMLREVITFVYEKSHLEHYYPNNLDFMSTSGKMLRYEKVAQIEHSGSYNMRTHQSGGHYWARVKNNKGWCAYNDINVVASENEVSKGAHMVVYHLMEESDITEQERRAIIARKKDIAEQNAKSVKAEELQRKSVNDIVKKYTNGS